MGDPGLQAERTALAWHRTAVSAAAVTGVAVLAAAHDGSPAGLAVVGLLGAGVTVLGAVAARRPGTAPGAPQPSPWGRLLATSAATMLLAVTGLTLALVSVAR